ncbi:hypothetical protein M427DRAFT_248255 [Gonapodya prolifera JEL478]|uniref:LysM domain-containing protein n=1 Tax=Gonapodya prolifera (strain JEL478) TaxID=1344416 RepID=A0A138ZXJ7_GONPJ|nr:hypothetical protein M427DRAFT_248255 [Gonapodya prolifera JEL478]|eukprot:KXS09209.1 hypothetical protein M427DRAFT_248255 [Gonapodya prolifera JEL478]
MLLWRKLEILVLSVIIHHLVIFASAYPGGSPCSADEDSITTSFHGASLYAGDGGYGLVVKQISTPGATPQKYTVTIYGPQAIEGLLVYSSLSDGTRVGSFVTTTFLQSLNCGGTGTNTLTHKDKSSKSMNITLQWNADTPVKQSSPVEIHAIVVLSLNEWYILQSVAFAGSVPTSGLSSSSTTRTTTKSTTVPQLIQTTTSSLPAIPTNVLASKSTRSSGAIARTRTTTRTTQTRTTRTRTTKTRTTTSRTQTTTLFTTTQARNTMLLYGSDVVCFKAHTISAGDTCYNLGIANNSTVQDLINLNSNMNCDNLPIGGRLCLYGTTLPCSKPYVVQGGDYCELIADGAGVTFDNLLLFNPGLDCDNFFVGDVLCLGYSTNGGGVTPPVNQPSSSCTSFYEVGDGDTCYLIAQKNGITPEQLVALNSQLNCTDFYVGDILCVSNTNRSPTVSPVIPVPLWTTTATHTATPTTTKTRTSTAMPTKTKTRTSTLTTSRTSTVTTSRTITVTTSSTTPLVTPSSGTCGKYYTVVDGDSCPLIAIKNSITLFQLQLQNPTLDCNEFYVDDVSFRSSW